MVRTSQASPKQERGGWRRLAWAGALLATGLAVGYSAYAGGVQPAMLPTCGYPPSPPPSTACFKSWCCDGVEWIECQFKAAGTSCSDGNACTTNDKCDGAGGCTGTAVVCQALDRCHDAGTCNPSSGCSSPLKADGTPCPDSNLCNGTETCQAGVCTVGTPLAVDDGNACTADSCDPATGTITHAAITSSCCASGVSLAGQTCRAAKGSCDPGAVCVATSPDCPISQALDGTVCATGVLTSTCKCASDGYCRTDRARVDVWYDATANVVSQKRLGINEACE